MAANEEEYLTTKQATAFLGVSAVTLGEYVKQGLIIKYEQRAPRRVLYKRSELQKLKEIRPAEQ